jgi:fluoroacetyl-CoA thioesterase
MQTGSVIGAVGISQMVVRPGDTALAHGSGDMPVLSTSFLITLMESACNSAIAEYLDNAESTVTNSMKIQINESVGIGSEVQGSATCVGVEEGNLLFECEIHDGTRVVAAALLSRSVIERVAYLARTAALTLMSQQSDVTT